MGLSGEIMIFGLMPPLVQEQKRADAAEKKATLLAEKLRAFGFDPKQL